jgi:hypothetical protein
MDLKRRDKEGLRGASRVARKAINTTVSKVEISEEGDLRDLPQLRLQERFPNLASVALKGCPEHLMDTIFNKFVVVTLCMLPYLTTVDLAHCKGLSAAAACAALLRCCQLQDLSLPEGRRIQYCHQYDVTCGAHNALVTRSK